MTKSEAITELIEAIKWHDARKHGKSWARVRAAATELQAIVTRQQYKPNDNNPT